MTHSPPTPEQWASNLRARRVAARIGRVDLAQLAHRSYQMIRDIELGRRNPSLETMQLVDAALRQAADQQPSDLRELRDEVADLRATVDRILRRMPTEGAVA